MRFTNRTLVPAVLAAALLFPLAGRQAEAQTTKPRPPIAGVQVVVRASVEVEGSVELVALEAGQRDERALGGARLPAERVEIGEVGLDVLVDHAHVAAVAGVLGRRQAGEVSDRRVGHEAAPEALDPAGGVVLAGLDDQDPECAHRGHATARSPRRQAA